jgi:hypothetical protein
VKETFAREFVYAPTMMFRGNRDYIHSTDIYGELISGASAAGLPPVDGMVILEIRTPLTRQPEFHFGADEQAKLPGAAVFRLGIGNDFAFGVILPTERHVVGRRPYDEGRIASEARVKDWLVALNTDTGMSPIEVLTALAVFQHKTLFPPPTTKRWLLARLSLVRPLRPQDATAMNISLDRVVGKSITRSTVSVPNERLGNLDFVLARV